MEYKNTQKTKYCNQCKLSKDINEFSTYKIKWYRKNTNIL